MSLPVYTVCHVYQYYSIRGRLLSIEVMQTRPLINAEAILSGKTWRVART
jgi:hypothetical protein